MRSHHHPYNMDKPVHDLRSNPEISKGLAGPDLLTSGKRSLRWTQSSRKTAAFGGSSLYDIYENESLDYLRKRNDGLAIEVGAESRVDGSGTRKGEGKVMSHECIWSSGIDHTAMLHTSDRARTYITCPDLLTQSKLVDLARAQKVWDLGSRLYRLDADFVRVCIVDVTTIPASESIQPGDLPSESSPPFISSDLC